MNVEDGGLYQLLGSYIPSSSRHPPVILPSSSRHPPVILPAGAVWVDLFRSWVDMRDVVCCALSLPSDFFMDSEDKQQRRRAQLAAAAQRHRDKKKTGQTIQHRSTPQEQHALLNTPYHTLTAEQKERVRYYRKQARKQAHRVAASFPPVPSSTTSSSIPSLTFQRPHASGPPTQQHYPLVTLSAAADLSSSSSAPSTPSSCGTPSVVTTTSTTIPPSPVHLVYPYEQALVRSQEPVETTQPAQTRSSTEVPTQQWKSSRDFLQQHVLLPRDRYQHMTQITNKSILGKYLSVFNIDAKQDIYPNSHGNIVQEMLGSPSITTTTSSTSTPAQRLKQVLPFTITTHTQQSYSQQTISAPRSPPTVSITTLSQYESYKRIVWASTASSPAASKHIFTPSININCVKDPAVRKRLIDIAREAQQYYKQNTPHKHQEVECDHVFSSPLDGFGISGLQVYIKSGECVTWLHDELLWCAALNYMLKESQGCALWIAVGLHDLKQVMSLAEIEELLLTTDINKNNILEAGTLLDTLIKSRIHIEYVMQKPGQLVSSPPGNGAAHLVYSYGTLMTQLAWNYSFTIPGAVQCLSYWGIDDNDDHLAIGNTSMATRTVLPLFTMQLQGYELGLMDQLQHYQELIKKLQLKDKKIKITHDPKLSSNSCDVCLHRQDWLRVNSQCIHCYFKNPKVLKKLK